MTKLSDGRDRVEQKIFRRVSVEIWTDRRFRALSPDARILFLYMLTTRHANKVPGIITLSRSVLCASFIDELYCRASSRTRSDRVSHRVSDTRSRTLQSDSRDSERAAPDESLTGPEDENPMSKITAHQVPSIYSSMASFDELEAAGMVRDLDSVVYLPKAIKHNLPSSAAQVASWLRVIRIEIPQEFQEDVEEEFVEVLRALGSEYVESFLEGRRKDLRGYRNGHQRGSDRVRDTLSDTLSDTLHGASGQGTADGTAQGTDRGTGAQKAVSSKQYSEVKDTTLSSVSDPQKPATDPRATRRRAPVALDADPTDPPGFAPVWDLWLRHRRNQDRRSAVEAFEAIVRGRPELPSIVARCARDMWAEVDADSRPDAYKFVKHCHRWLKAQDFTRAEPSDPRLSVGERAITGMLWRLGRSEPPGDWVLGLPPGTVLGEHVTAPRRVETLSAALPIAKLKAHHDPKRMKGWHCHGPCGGRHHVPLDENLYWAMNDGMNFVCPEIDDLGREWSSEPCGCDMGGPLKDTQAWGKSFAAKLPDGAIIGCVKASLFYTTPPWFVEGGSQAMTE